MYLTFSALGPFLPRAVLSRPGLYRQSPLEIFLHSLPSAQQFLRFKTAFNLVRSLTPLIHLVQPGCLQTRSLSAMFNFQTLASAALRQRSHTTASQIAA